MSWRVNKILDGKKITVSPNWSWNGHTGNTVVINGYNVALTNLPFAFADATAKNRLTSIISNQTVKLKNPTAQVNGVLYCDVYFNDVNISKYFADFDKNTLVKR